MNQIKKKIKEILLAKAAQYESDIMTVKKKLLVPIKDYINNDGIRVRVYGKKSTT